MEQQMFVSSLILVTSLLLVRDCCCLDSDCYPAQNIRFYFKNDTSHKALWHIPNGETVIAECNEGYSSKAGHSLVAKCTDGLLHPSEFDCEPERWCPPINVQFGSVHPAKAQSERMPMGTVVDFSCNDDTSISIDSWWKSTCRYPGWWDNEPATCYKKCSEPKVEHGHYSIMYFGDDWGSYSHYALLEIHCDKNENEKYVLENDLADLVTCRNGTWFYLDVEKVLQPAGDIICKLDPTTTKKPAPTTTEIPSHEKKCTLPPDENRIIDEDYSDITDLDWIKPGEYVVMSCKEGFFTRTPELECGNTGTWNEGDVHVCERVWCTVPELPSGVSLESKTGTYRYKENLIVSCDLDNHIFMGHKQKATLQIECLGENNGTGRGGWAIQVPKCKKIRCPYIRYLEDGEFIGQASTSYVGDSVTARCLRGKLVGPTTRWCTKHGTWNGTLQVCVVDEGGCGNPGVPISGRKMGSNYDVGDVVRFECDTGTVLHGDASRTCQSTKKWSGRQPICTG